MAGKKQAAAEYDDSDDDADVEDWDDTVEEPELPAGPHPDIRLRDWRDVERYREMRELRQLVDDDDVLDEIFSTQSSWAPPRAAEAAPVVQPRQSVRSTKKSLAPRKAAVAKAARKAGTRRRNR